MRFNYFAGTIFAPEKAKKSDPWGAGLFTFHNIFGKQMSILGLDIVRYQYY